MSCHGVNIFYLRIITISGKLTGTKFRYNCEIHVLFVYEWGWLVFSNQPYPHLVYFLPKFPFLTPLWHYIAEIRKLWWPSHFSCNLRRSHYIGTGFTPSLQCVSGRKGSNESLIDLRCCLNTSYLAIWQISGFNWVVIESLDKWIVVSLTLQASQFFL